MTIIKLDLSRNSHLAELIDQYPAPLAAYQAIQSHDFRRSFVRLWLSEGIPFAFRQYPAAYESIREWLGYRLSVDPKCITIIGSSRIGFSLAPQRKWAPHRTDSDLDFSLISPDLFTKMCGEFKSWESDCETGVLGSLDRHARRYWPENLEFGKRNIPKGFFDANKSPGLDR